MYQQLALGLVLALCLPAGASFAQGVAGPATPHGSRCAVAVSPVHGCAVTIIKGPGTHESSSPSTKQGRACAWNLLMLISAGDMRISTAKQNGGIARVSSIDYQTFELIPYFGGFSRYCTVVSGS